MTSGMDPCNSVKLLTCCPRVSSSISQTTGRDRKGSCIRIEITLFPSRELKSTPVYFDQSTNFKLA
uniref:Uncharacterized protein n=1 Tax=Arundo donax TaxID=35708 RepID=A0A0A8ZP64_ARUDO